ncbi:hypothetical protein GLUCORHAEAF1_05310 [Komagataeibacter rhaeticus AF1]|nr:hypothetical protein GLUCORHAEAF1_05310 [Komagataeibacter rhaeticus AF1]
MVIAKSMVFVVGCRKIARQAFLSVPSSRELNCLPRSCCICKSKSVFQFFDLSLQTRSMFPGSEQMLLKSVRFRVLLSQ